MHLMKEGWETRSSCLQRPFLKLDLTQDEIAEMKAAEAAKEKLVGDVVRENRQLAEPLAQVK